MIPQRNLSLIANKLAKRGGIRIPEKVIELDYCLAWFLIGLYRAELGQHLAFKGGTALRRCHFGEYRFSEDLDFTLLKQDLSLEDIQRLLPEVFHNVKASSGGREARRAARKQPYVLLGVYRSSGEEVHRQGGCDHQRSDRVSSGGKPGDQDL